MAPLFSSIFILLYVYALLIDPHVIHSHEDWERGGLIRITRPVSTNCDVQDKEEWIIKRIRLPIHHARVDGEIFTVIHQKMNLILGPIHGEHMEFAIKMIGGKYSWRSLDDSSLANPLPNAPFRALFLAGDLAVP